MGTVSVLGMGFCCIDIIKEEQQTDYYVGGTAANVMCGLAYLGARTLLLVPHYNDIYASYLERSIAECGVHMIHTEAKRYAVPKVIEQLLVGGHTFKTTCPLCGANLSQTVLPTERDMENLEIDAILENQNAVFYDRISSGIKHCIGSANDLHVWTYYEPNSGRRYDTFLKNASLSSVVKFSSESIPAAYVNRAMEDLSCKESNTHILIVTDGNTGVRFSTKKNGRFREWIHVPGEQVTTPFDTAGAGDWFTASFLNSFLQRFPAVQTSVDAETLFPMICHAQKIAALSCEYKGAQGMLFSEAASRETGKLMGTEVKRRKRVKFSGDSTPICGCCGSALGT